ncbi:MAG: hypothetical protein ABI742_06855, partial [Gemmatimonadota bacterium]
SHHSAGGPMTTRVELHVEAGAVGRAPRGTDGRWTDEQPYQTGPELRAAIARQARGNGRPDRLLVVLEPAVVQRRDLVDLPPVPHRELDRLVARGAARFFRQNGHPLVTAVTHSTRNLPEGLVVHAIAVDAALAEAILAGAREGGAGLTDIVAAETGPGLSLLPADERIRRERQAWTHVAHLAAGTLLLWTLTAGVLTGWIAWQARVVDRDLGRLEEPRLALAAARRAMDSASAMVDSVATLGRETAALATRLQDVIAALPDSMLLTRLELDPFGAGDLEGRAATAHVVAERLAAVSGLRDVRLTESGSRDSSGGVIWERFTIRLGREPAP